MAAGAVRGVRVVVYSEFPRGRKAVNDSNGIDVWQRGKPIWLLQHWSYAIPHRARNNRFVAGHDRLDQKVSFENSVWLADIKRQRGDLYRIYSQSLPRENQRRAPDDPISLSIRPLRRGELLDESPRHSPSPSSSGTFGIPINPTRPSHEAARAFARYRA